MSLCNWILFKETSSHKLCSEQQRYCSQDKNHHSVNGGDAIELYCMIFYICGYKPYRFLDTQVSLAPTHVSPLGGHTFETAGVKRNLITYDDLSCCSELPESKDGNVYKGLNTRAMYMKA